ncbi:MAG: VanZ family protein [Clostridiales bacterium]|nr:VanZ family protein [Clostridiales bacterium]
MVLFYFLFFSESMGRNGEATFEVNLVPLREIRRFWELLSYPQWRFAAFLNLAGNIVIFMPFGGFAALLVHPKEKWYLITLLSLELSLLVELIQLAARTGCFDVDDLILNTLGGLMGYIAYKLWKRFYPGAKPGDGGNGLHG